MLRGPNGNNSVRGHPRIGPLACGLATNLGRSWSKKVNCARQVGLTTIQHRGSYEDHGPPSMLVSGEHAKAAVWRNGGICCGGINCGAWRSVLRCYRPRCPARPAPPDPLAGSAGGGDSYYPLDGNGGYDAVDYDISIDYDPPTHQLIGHARLHAAATQPLQAFNLDYTGPPVQAVKVNGLPAGIDRNGEDVLTITPDQMLLPGMAFTVTVDYSGLGEFADQEGGEVGDGRLLAD
ncbi:hypothetical protein ACFYV7_39430 [Nocardia suismassiliense]|uniref:SbsA Ig-like domain-containing protein n=1 Tax=Nocardia suismassiliense TaxID=2077092 RepID=A0ABW6R5W3_9NOCA